MMLTKKEVDLVGDALKEAAKDCKHLATAPSMIMALCHAVALIDSHEALRNDLNKKAVEVAALKARICELLGHVKYHIEKDGKFRTEKAELSRKHREAVEALAAIDCQNPVAYLAGCCGVRRKPCGECGPCKARKGGE